ncbi:hypothetical protein [Absidia glauca]|uniref:E2F-associated phosphoprotein n=1 Tax=Absidia glauca TaxID=4829 RepID=A0A168M5Q8_ABSGL|nr:hypothetical protein [Absidia glauca]
MNQQDKYYDTVYFDSDDDNDNPSTSHQSKQDPERHERLTNDHLLYDPLGDEKDEAWVAEQITKTAPKSLQKDQQARTDALLSCPMCFSPLCYSCQRHESYSHQFRAMFVTNCQVNKKERYRYDAKDDAPAEGYYVVKCETCDTHVAMMDEEEVYHFFNVIAN